EGRTVAGGEVNRGPGDDRLVQAAAAREEVPVRQIGRGDVELPQPQIGDRERRRAADQGGGAQVEAPGPVGGRSREIDAPRRRGPGGCLHDPREGGRAVVEVRRGGGGGEGRRGRGRRDDLVQGGDGGVEVRVGEERRDDVVLPGRQVEGRAHRGPGQGQGE